MTAEVRQVAQCGTSSPLPPPATEGPIPPCPFTLGDLMPDSGEMTPAELGRTVKRLELRVEDGFKKSEAGVAHLQDMILALSTTYVRLDLYLSERDAMRTDIDNAKKIAMWSLGAIASLVIGAIVIAMIQASGVGRP